MSVIGTVVDIFTSGGIGSILGGVTGLVGTWLKGRHELEMWKLRADERKDQRAHELAIMSKESENAIALANVHRQEADDVASGQALKASYDMEPKRFSEGLSFPNTWYGRLAKSWVAFLMFHLDFFRGLMRPGLTVYMAILNTMIYWEYRALVETYAIQPTPEEAHAVTMYFISSFTYLFTTAYVWWYGDRNRQQPPKTL